MNWTKEKPTEPGWYWAKSGRCPYIRLVFKSAFDEKLRVTFVDHNKSKLVDECDGYWMGPIEEPEESA